MTRLNVLLNTAVIEIGRKSACSCGAVISGTGIIDSSFHCLGTVKVAMDLLNKRISGPQKTGAPRRKNYAGSKSIPVALLWSLSKISNIRKSVIRLQSMDSYSTPSKLCAVHVSH